MKLTLNGIQDRAAWERAGVALPAYDVAAVRKNTTEHPMWVHFGIGNIFRVFIGSIADKLLTGGATERGLTAIETFDFEVVDRIYDPYDDLTLAVYLNADGTETRQVFAAITEAVRARSGNEKDWARMKEIFADPALQLASFTITEKGYALKGADGAYLPYVARDMEQGPGRVTGAMGIVTAMLLARFEAGAYPVALVSMDNVSRNGSKLEAAVLETAQAWLEKGYVTSEFVDYISKSGRVTFPWTMIDKITPRPSETVAQRLEEAGVEDMGIVVTGKVTYIAPFVNAEKPQYLVIEDSFPNGRPPFEQAGVYMADRDTVNKSERMKVTACLNPIHTALGPYMMMMGYELFADGMSDPLLSVLGHTVGYGEGLPVVDDPGIISPKAFIDEVIERMRNEYLGDTSARICVDASQCMAPRFGETIKTYVARDGSAEKLVGIPLAIAGWLRYLVGRDDKGNAIEISPDPMAEPVRKALEGIKWDDPDSVGDKLRPILSNAGLFGVDLYRAGLGEKIGQMFGEQLRGKGSVTETLKKYIK